MRALLPVGRYLGELERDGVPADVVRIGEADVPLADPVRAAVWLAAYGTAEEPLVDRGTLVAALDTGFPADAVTAEVDALLRLGLLVETDGGEAFARRYRLWPLGLTLGEVPGEDGCFAISGVGGGVVVDAERFALWELAPEYPDLWRLCEAVAERIGGDPRTVLAGALGALPTLLAGGVACLDTAEAAEDYERLYSAAARMVAAQGPATTRDDWPQARRERWRELELLLTAPPVDDAAGVADPAWQLAARLDPAGQPIGIAEAARDWDRRLATAGGAAVALPGPLYTVVTDLLEELVQRLAPGRPAVTVGDGGTDLSELAHELAGRLRPERPDDHPPLREPRPLSAGLPLPAAAERLAAVARSAAEATPTPQELAATADFGVHRDAAVAAADLLAGTGWRERHDGIRPGTHLVSIQRWEGAGWRPVGLAERAAELRTALRDLPPPRPPAPAEEAGWVVLPHQAALVTAELLDELGVRLRPGRRVGTVRLGTLALQEFVRTRLRRATIEP
ncbi:hypothetical protein KZZ52_18745 [Dactylosporangium sp. AC04546]|uniref:hypothetical protein n=1 Tax=Dactylosporangium sp. AC04546 TaxID=2862460 RepID=UPI001EDEFF1B|nr:hypothetical protein [Dactylosporangium sp. AC04546]WVK87342.1 hypothetical protein KZZ52_18745 [Dactylosporangium sp. AC04546]